MPGQCAVVWPSFLTFSSARNLRTGSNSAGAHFATRPSPCLLSWPQLHAVRECQPMSPCSRLSTNHESQSVLLFFLSANRLEKASPYICWLPSCCRYVDYILETVSKRELFQWLSLAPTKWWHALLLRDRCAAPRCALLGGAAASCSKQQQASPKTDGVACSCQHCLSAVHTCCTLSMQ